MVTKQKIQILLNIKRFCLKQLGNIILYVKIMIKVEIYE